MAFALGIQAKIEPNNNDFASINHITEGLALQFSYFTLVYSQYNIKWDVQIESTG